MSNNDALPDRSAGTVSEPPGLPGALPGRPPATAPGRLWPLDAARGLALCAMFVFHFTWDLSFLRLIELDIASHPGWLWFARLIAGSFLFLSGIGLCLAQGRAFRWEPFLRRLGTIAGAAALVSLVTYVAMPGAGVWFGILHAIAATGVLALPFVRMPVLVTVLAAALCLAAPHFLAAEAFDAPQWYWLGLRTMPPNTVDYVPVLPWLGVVLAGVAAGRLGLPQRLAAIIARRSPGRPARLLAFGGRHSLAVYLVHQPVFLAVLWTVAVIVGPISREDELSLRAECRAQCAVSGPSAQTCGRYCGCAEEELKKMSLWRDATRGALSAKGQEQLAAIVGLCRRQAGIDPMPPAQ